MATPIKELIERCKQFSAAAGKQVTIVENCFTKEFIVFVDTIVFQAADTKTNNFLKIEGKNVTSEFDEKWHTNASMSGRMDFEVLRQKIETLRSEQWTFSPETKFIQVRAF